MGLNCEDLMEINTYTDFIKANPIDLLDSHSKVIAYWKEKNDIAEYLIGFSQGAQYTEEELQAFRNKRKLAVTLNRLKASERRILGHFSTQMFDLQFSPIGDEDQKIAEILNKMWIWESNAQNYDFLDIDILRQCWATGNAFQEIWVDLQPYSLPKIRSANRNRFSVYFDPESREPITRDDANFLDIASYQSLDDLIAMFPEKKDLLLENLSQKGQDTGYQTDDKIIDRDIETQAQKNNTFKVIERLIRVRKSYAKSWDNEENDFVEWETDDEETHEIAMKRYQAHNIQTMQKECLWLIVAVDGVPMNEYLYSGPYHAQPINPVTNKIMWPIVEFACEIVNGETMGFVQHEVEAQKIINSMMSNVVDSARNASGAGKLYVENAFKDQKTANDFAKFGADSNRNFAIKEDYFNRVAENIPKSNVNQDNHNAINYANEIFNEISSTPPSTQGLQAGSESGVLNQQRIEQALIQIAPFIQNYRRACKRRIELIYAYWREFYTEKRVFRITNDKGENEQVAINEQVVNAWGEIEKVNDINTALYDIALTTSSKSPTYRMKTQGQISQILSSPAMATDPILSARLTAEFVHLSDLSPEVKEFALAHTNKLKLQASEELDQQLQAKQQELQATQQQIQALQQQGEQDKKNLTGEYAQTLSKLELQVAKLESQIADKQLEIANAQSVEPFEMQLNRIQQEQMRDFA